MTATEELRRLLDERGVEWHDTKLCKGFITVYEHDCITWIVTEHSSGRLSVKGCVKPTQGHYDGMTPKQAVEATLGRGTCRILHMEREDETGCMAWAECDSCGAMLNGWKYLKGASYCPYCGRRVADDCR